MKRIESLKDSPCYSCPNVIECESKLQRSPKLEEVKDNVIFNTNIDYKQCGIYVALTAPEMIDES